MRKDGGWRRRLRAHRRAVLEGVPLTVLISILIIAIGAVLLLSLFSYAKVTSLGALSVATPSGSTKQGFILAQPTQLEVTAWAQSGGHLGGVGVVLNGSGVSQRGLTAGNGSVFFWVVPVLHYHASSGVLTVSATYSPTVSLASPPTQSYTVSLMVLS